MSSKKFTLSFLSSFIRNYSAINNSAIIFDFTFLTIYYNH